MPPNDSSTGGYLVPASTPAPLEDGALDDFLGDLVAGITGLDRDTAVRPRWQPEPPDAPDYGTDWASVGVVSRRGDTFAVEQHDADGQGSDALIRHEELDVVCTFYGPNAGSYAARLRDGLSVAQNREALTLAQMGLVSVGDLTKTAELLKNRWLPRNDLPFTVRRAITRVYPVLNLESASGSIETAVITETFQASGA